MSSGFPPSNATSARNYTAIKKDGVSVEPKCTSIDVVGDMASVTSLGGGAVQIGVSLQEYITEPASPEPNTAWVFKDTPRVLGGGLAAIGLLVGPGTPRYYIRFKTDAGNVVGVELT